MLERCKALWTRYREILLYVLFGGLTTVVDWAVSFLLYSLWGAEIDANVFLIHAANVLAWAAAVLFAYITNRIWVFQSKRHGLFPILGELCSFAGGRILTLLLQEGIFFIFFDILAWNEYLVKIAAAVLVVILNYIISKLFVFRKKKDSVQTKHNKF